MGTFDERLARLENATAAGPQAMSQYSFRKLLTDAEADAWIELVEKARKAVADGTATDVQRVQLRAWNDYHLPPGIELDAPETQAAIYALHLWEVLSQVRADQVAQGIPPS